MGFKLQCIVLQVNKSLYSYNGAATISYHCNNNNCNRYTNLKHLHFYNLLFLFQGYLRLFLPKHVN